MIGNIITYKNKLSIIIAIEEDCFKIGDKYDKDNGREWQVCRPEYNFGHFLPIELSEDHLYSLGFSRVKNRENDNNKIFEAFGNSITGYFNNGAFRLEIQENNTIWMQGYNSYINIKYVHQLQNIYYLLTGNNLKYVTSL